MTDPEVDCLSLPTYAAHLVPCKVRYTGATEEFKDNFRMDLSHGESLKKVEPDSQHNTSHVTYFRGRKVVGQEILSSSDYDAFLMSTSEASDASETKIAKPIAKISSVINYERDGNEDRLREEIDKFNEFIELNDIVHS